ncbi:MFS transporter, partial [Candidatus Poribacteria bacterium]|nr:MFS transporter [Candidatus Poribacteria bacterium]
VLPLLAAGEFGVGSKAATLSFIASFGAVKAVSNLIAGRLADTHGRRRVLIAGWLVGTPVPLLLMWAPSWGWVVGANVLLGVNQGFTWSAVQIMKVDLVSDRRRGLAMGVNEFAGYTGVAAAAYGTGVIASRMGLRPAPFVLGVACAAIGLGLSLLTRETSGALRSPASELVARPHASLWRNRRYQATCALGLLNNLRDSVMWGLAPLLLAARGMDVGRIGSVSAAYLAAWGCPQILTGPLSDRVGRRPLVVAGLACQAIGLALLTRDADATAAPYAAIAIGLGTALVYPTLLAAAPDVTPGAPRGTVMGVYRSLRDGGYVVGAAGAGPLADAVGITTTMALLATVMGLSIAPAFLLPGRARPT